MPVPSEVAPVSMHQVPMSALATTALILDAHLKSSLAAIRSLGKRGIPVVAASHRGTAMGLQSRYVTDTFVYPSPLHDRSGFTDAVVGYTSRAGPVVLLAFSD